MPLPCWQATRWYQHDPFGNPTLSCCFSCADGIGQIRPNLTPQQAAEVLKDPRSDPSFPKDLEVMIGIQDGEQEPDLSTRTAVDHAKEYAFEVFQDFGCLTATEYKALTGQTPDPNSKIALSVKFSGPDQPATQMYTVGLEGLAPDKLASIRKVRLSFKNGITTTACLLEPERQMLRDQGSRIFKHVASDELSRRPDSWKLGAKKPPPTIQELKAQSEQDQMEQENMKAHALYQARKKADNFDEGLDEWDSDAEDMDAAAAAAALPSQPSRQAGLDMRALSDEETTKPAPKRKGKGGKGAGKSSKNQQHQDATAPEPAVSVTSKKSTAGSSGLDHQMKFVAEKHLSTGTGSSTTSLQHLNVATFLADSTSTSDDRHLAAYMRGVISSVDAVQQMNFVRCMTV